MKRRIESTFAWPYRRQTEFSNPITNIPVDYSYRGNRICEQFTYAVEMWISSTCHAQTVFLRFLPMEIIPCEAKLDYSRILVVIRKLRSNGILGPLLKRENYSWEFQLRPNQGEPFGEAAIRTAMAVYEACGVGNLVECLRQFEFNQKTLVRYQGRWEYYPSYLLRKFGLETTSIA